MKIRVGTTEYSVSILVDDTIERVRQKVGQVLNVHPDYLFIYVESKPKQFNYATWNEFFKLLERNGEIDRNKLQTFMDNTNPKGVVPEDLPILTESVWNQRLVNFLNELYEREYTEFIPIGMIPNENKGVYPLAITKLNSDCSPIGNLVYHDSMIWNDGGYSDILYVKQAAEIDNSCHKLYFPLLKLSGDTNITGRIPAFPAELNASLERDSKIIKHWETLESEMQKSKYYKTIIDKYTNSGYLRIRWKHRYNPADRFLTLEQLFHAIPVNNIIPAVIFQKNLTQPSSYKMFAPAEGKVYVEESEFKRWLRVSFPKTEPILLLYRYPETKDGKMPIVRMGITEEYIHIAIENQTSTNLISEEVMEELSDVLFSHIKPFISNINPDKVWESSTYRIVFDPAQAGCIIPATKRDALFSALDPYILPITDTTKGNIILFYKRVSDFGSRNEKDEFVVNKLSQGLSADQVFKEYQGVYPTIDQAQQEQAYARILELDENSALAFLKNVRILFPTTYSMEIQGITNKDLATKIQDFCQVLLAICFPKLRSSSQIFKTTIDTLIPSKPIEIKANKLEDVSEKEEFGFDGDFLSMLNSVLEQPDFIPKVDQPKPHAVADEPDLEEDEEGDITKSGSTHRIILSRLKKHDPQKFKTPADIEPRNRYSKLCKKESQPIVFSYSEWDGIKKDGSVPGILNDFEGNKDLVIDDSEKKNKYICPDYFCIRDEIPLMEKDLLKVDGKKVCPKCNGQIIPDLPASKQHKLDYSVYTLVESGKDFKYPRFVKKTMDSDLFDSPLPCCYISAKEEKDTPARPKKDETANYILQEDRFPLPSDQLRFGLLPAVVDNYLGLNSSSNFVKDGHIMKPGTTTLLRKSVAQPVIMNTLHEIQGKKSEFLEDIRNFMSLSNGNLIRLYGKNWQRASEDQRKQFGIWAETNSYESDDKYMFRIWSAWKEYTTRVFADDLPLSHVWDLLQRESNCKVIVFNFNDPDAPYIRCPPLGADTFESEDIILFVEKGCIFEPVVLAEKVKNKMNYTLILNHKLLESKGIHFKFPEQLYDTCRMTTKLYVPPKQLNVSNLNVDDVLILDPYSRIIAAYDSSKNGLYAVYPTALPATVKNEFVYGYQTEFLKPVKAQIDYLLQTNEPYLKPTRLIILHQKPETIVAIETQSFLRIPVQPEVLRENYDLEKTVVPSFDANIDTALIFPGKWGVIDSVDKSIRNDMLRDWVLFELTEFLHSKEGSPIFERLTTESEKTKQIVKLLEDWISDTFTNKAPKSLEFPKYKSNCSSSETCSGVCSLDSGTCKVSLAMSDLTPESILEWVLYALYSDDKKRYRIMNGTYPRITASLYWPSERELVFSENDPYPDFVGRKCIQRTLFDEVRDENDEIVCQ